MLQDDPTVLRSAAAYLELESDYRAVVSLF
jgi:hypothetical protein